MAIGWLSVLKLVPWTDVVKNAPVVADGAKKLWGAVAKKPVAPEPSVAPDPPAAAPDGRLLGALQGRVASVESATAGLQQQMLESTELIKALAEQNIQLVKRVEAHRRWLLWLCAATALIAAGAAIGVVVALARSAG